MKSQPTKSTSEGEQQDATLQPNNLHRRSFVALGAGLTGASLLQSLALSFPNKALASSGSESAGDGQTLESLRTAATPTTISQRGIVVKAGGGRKAVYLPAPGVQDPAILSIAETLFWSDIMQEHAKFIEIHLAAPELDPQKREAAYYRQQFQTQFARAAETELSATSLVPFNMATMRILVPFIRFKRKLHVAQRQGLIRSLAFPSFLDHIATEAEQFLDRLQRLSRRQVDFFDQKTAQFWLEIMGEHFALVAHLLDPQEKDLIAISQNMSLRLTNFSLAGLSRTTALAELRQVIATKEELERKVVKAEVASIIHPALADHVRREAEKASDDIARIA